MTDSIRNLSTYQACLNKKDIFPYSPLPRSRKAYHIVLLYLATPCHEKNIMLSNPQKYRLPARLRKNSILPLHTLKVVISIAAGAGMLRCCNNSLLGHFDCFWKIPDKPTILAPIFILWDTEKWTFQNRCFQLILFRLTSESFQIPHYHSQYSGLLQN